MLSLAAAWWLLALPLPLIVWLLARRLRQHGHRGQQLRHPQAALLAQLQGQLPPQSAKPPWLWLLTCGLLVLALARPQWLDDTPPGRNFMLAIDISGSMRALDFSQGEQAISRLDMLKQVVDGFLDSRVNDRVGLVIFGDDAYTLAPLTHDLNLLRRLLRDVDNGIAGEKTALGPAVAIGVKRLQHEDPRSRTLILLTDGTHTSGAITPATALEMAQYAGVRIYAVGIGSKGKVLFPRGPAQRADYKEVPMDEGVLQSMAEESGGEYFRANAPGELERIISEIDRLATIPLDGSQRRAEEWYWLPLALAIVLIAAAQLAPRIPSRHTTEAEAR